MFPRRYAPYIGGILFAIVLLGFFGGYTQQWQPETLNTPKPLTTTPIADHCLASPNQPLRILPVGDSLTAGEGSSDFNGYRLQLHNHLRTDCPQRELSFHGTQESGTDPVLHSEGYAGYDIERILNLSNPGIEWTIAQNPKPNVILLHIGTNNMGALRPPDIVEPEQAPEKLEELVDWLLSLSPSIVLIVAQLVYSPNPVWKENSEVYNAAIPAIVKRKVEKGYKVMTVDMSSVGGQCVKELFSDVVCGDLLEDGVHPRDEGYRKMAGLWFGALVRATEMGWFEKGVS